MRVLVFGSARLKNLGWADRLRHCACRPATREVPVLIDTCALMFLLALGAIAGWSQRPIVSEEFQAGFKQTGTNFLCILPSVLRLTHIRSVLESLWPTETTNSGLDRTALTQTKVESEREVGKGRYGGGASRRQHLSCSRSYVMLNLATIAMPSPTENGVTPFSSKLSDLAHVSLTLSS